MYESPFIKNKDYKYIRALGAFYWRLIAQAKDVYKVLEPHPFQMVLILLLRLPELVTVAILAIPEVLDILDRKVILDSLVLVEQQDLLAAKDSLVRKVILDIPDQRVILDLPAAKDLQGLLQQLPVLLDILAAKDLLDHKVILDQQVLKVHRA